MEAITNIGYLNNPLPEKVEVQEKTTSLKRKRSGTESLSVHIKAAIDEALVGKLQELQERIKELEEQLSGKKKKSVPRTFHRISLSKAKSVVKHMLVNVWGAGVAP